jgi:hypothetical protein
VYPLAHRTKPPYNRQQLDSSAASQLRWIDYVVSAPIMFAVLSVSWGCASAMLVAAGSFLQAVGIVLARASDPLMDKHSVSQVSAQQAVDLDRFLAAVHLGGVVVFLDIAAHRNLLGLSVPLRSDWSTEPFEWYRVKPNNAANASAVHCWRRRPTGVPRNATTTSSTGTPLSTTTRGRWAPTELAHAPHHNR